MTEQSTWQSESLRAPLSTPGADFLDQSLQSWRDVYRAKASASEIIEVGAEFLAVVVAAYGTAKYGQHLVKLVRHARSEKQAVQSGLRSYGSAENMAFWRSLQKLPPNRFQVEESTLGPGTINFELKALGVMEPHGNDLVVGSGTLFLGSQRFHSIVLNENCRHVSMKLFRPMLEQMRTEGGVWTAHLTTPQGNKMFEKASDLGLIKVLPKLFDDPAPIKPVRFEVP